MIKCQTIEIYNCTVAFLFNPDRTEFELWYHDNVSHITDDEYKQMYKDLFANDHCGGFTQSLDCGDVVCCIKELDSKDYIAHEILHTTNKILLSRGVAADFDNDEPQTYLCGWLTKKFYEYLESKDK